jgi:hypothetical protein
MTKTIKPAPEYSTNTCHGHGRTVHLSTQDLDALDTVSFAKRNVAPYISPILDTATLSLVCKDLGISGRAIPKVIKGRQYNAFSGYSGLRTMFPGTIYSANNRKIITMAIGALGIKNMVKNGGVLTIYITVSLTILEAFLKDHSSIYALAGNLASDLIKVGIGSVIMAIGGLGISIVTTSVGAPIAVAIIIGIFTNEMLDSFDRQYKITQKLVESLECMVEKINKATATEAETVKDSVVKGFDGFLRGQGLKIPRY